jgi:hypothetical protein
VITDVNTDLTHHLNGERMDAARWTVARTSDFKLIPGNGTEPTLCHLAAGRISGAKDKNSFFHSFPTE